MKMSWKVAAATAGVLLASVPAFADVKAVVSIECDPDTDAVVHFQASSGSPVTSVPGKCTDAIKALDDAHFKVKEALDDVSATTINVSPGSTAGTSAPSHSNYLFVFYLD